MSRNSTVAACRAPALDRPVAAGPRSDGHCTGSSCTRPSCRREPDAAAARALANRRAPRKTCRGPKDRKKTPRGDPTVRNAFSRRRRARGGALPLAASAQPLHATRSASSWSSPGRPADSARPARNRSRWPSATSTMRAASPAASSSPTLRDSQSQGTVAVDAARQLVQVKKVPAIIGGIISSVSIPILTSVTAPGERRADLARLLLADADRARPRRARPTASSSAPSRRTRCRAPRRRNTPSTRA